MEINIIRDINDEITCNKIKFRLIAGAKNRRIVVLFVAGLFISFLDYNSINLAIGMIFIGASLMLYYETHLLGMTSITNNKKKISEYKGNNRTIEININDSFLSHETMKVTYEWTGKL